MIFIDEFGTHLGMTRRYARAPKGKRACGKAPCNTDPMITLVMGLSLWGPVAPLAFEGAMDGIIFETYIREGLAPHLLAGDVVIVDGLGAHRVRGVRDALRARGVCFRFLPPYSPDLSPVENCGSKVKEAVRAEQPRTVQAVYDALGRAIGKVTPRDAEGWFFHAGYLRGRRCPTRYRPRLPCRRSSHRNRSRLNRRPTGATRRS